MNPEIPSIIERHNAMIASVLRKNGIVVELRLPVASPRITYYLRHHY